MLVVKSWFWMGRSEMIIFSNCLNFYYKNFCRLETFPVEIPPSSLNDSSLDVEDFEELDKVLTSDLVSILVSSYSSS